MYRKAEHSFIHLDLNSIHLNTNELEHLGVIATSISLSRFRLL